MIDTLTISVKKEAVLVPSLERIRETKSMWGITTEGNYRNLTIRERNDLVTISGSLTKFLKYENVSNLTFDECKEAIYSLCNLFSVEPEDATIKRIDFAKTINVDFEPKCYYQLLGNHRSYFRSPYKNSLNYSNSNRRLNFYDKAKEQRIIGNLLRYEKKFFRPDLVFNKKLLLTDLLTEDVFDHFTSSWKADYQKIEKVKKIIPMEKIRSPKLFFDHLAAMAASEIGRDSIYNQIQIAQRTGSLSKQNAKRIRDKMNRLSKSDFYRSNGLIDELDSKVFR